MIERILHEIVDNDIAYSIMKMALAIDALQNTQGGGKN
jgi:hypothetical protein